MPLRFTGLEVGTIAHRRGGINRDFLAGWGYSLEEGRVGAAFPSGSSSAGWTACSDSGARVSVSGQFQGSRKKTLSSFFSDPSIHPETLTLHQTRMHGDGSFCSRDFRRGKYDSGPGP